MPAGEALPSWFRKLQAVESDQVSTTNNALTVKRCMPFLDAMTLGWILPLCATVRLEIAENGARLDAGWDFDRTMISFHNPEQVRGHPLQPRPPAKVHNYWSIRTPKGWSCLFTPLLNRESAPIEILSGVVDTDQYHAHIHFPFFATGPDGRYTLEKGLPLVQVIPFQRAAMKADIRAERPEESASRVKILRATQAGDGWYRLNARARR